MTRAPINALVVLTVDGDAMAPSLQHGDAAIIDRPQCNPLGREGPEETAGTTSFRSSALRPTRCSGD